MRQIDNNLIVRRNDTSAVQLYVALATGVPAAKFKGIDAMTNANSIKFGARARLFGERSAASQAFFPIEAEIDFQRLHLRYQVRTSSSEALTITPYVGWNSCAC